jgi:hypothetical protein
MRVTLGKRLFVFLAVVALIGGPWLQALAQGSLHRCDMPTIAAGSGNAANQAAPCDTPAHKTDAGKTMPVVCAQDCLVQMNLVVPAAEMHFEGLTHVFEPVIRAAMDGHPPEPELSPPIALT